MPKRSLSNDQVLAFLSANAGPAGNARARQAARPNKRNRSALVNTPTVDHNTALRVRVTAPLRPTNTGGIKRSHKRQPASVIAARNAIHWTR